MDRRQVLVAGAGALASAWLAGCGGGGGGSSAPIPPSAPAPGPATGPDWAALGRRMQGALLQPADGGFETLRLPANAHYDGIVPKAIARCARAEDVAAALAFALENQVAFTPRSGGHSYLGASTSAGLVIDTGPMDTIRMDGDIAVAGAGAKLADVYRALLALPTPRLLPSGSCVTVGIAGITLGGGFGYFQRAHGLTCDALVGATLVAADGKTLVCDAGQNADLFWALRGGGGGHFGIVTELRLQTQPVPALSSCSASFANADVAAALSAWQAWSATLPDTVWSQVQLGAGAGGQVTMVIAALAMDGTAPLTGHWNRLLASVGALPVAQSPATSRTAADLLLGACAGRTPAQCHLPSQVSGGTMQRVAMTASSDFFHQPLPAAGVQALIDALAARGRSGRTGLVLLDQMGGAIARVAADATAFPHRAALFSAQYLNEAFPGTAASALDEAATWVHGLRDTMKPWSSGGAYVNYPDAAIADPADAYYGANLARLRSIRAVVDPNQVFKTALAAF